MKPYWSSVNESILAQGDYLPDCHVPLFHQMYGIGSDAVEEVAVSPANLIIVTQSCDLAQHKVSLVALCPIHRLQEFEEENPDFCKRGAWESVRKGRREGLHLLASPDGPENNQDARVVDFRQIFSLPFGYLINRAEELGNRWRLDSPFLEHFSQAFARFFMRVGLPSSIPPY